MAEFKMPSLGADMEAGTLYDWRVKPGDRVERGDIIASVETDKGVIDVEVFEEGVVAKLLIEEGDEVPVGTVLAIINGDGETVEKTAVTAVTPAKVAVSEPHPMDQRTLVKPAKTPAPATNGKRIRISPAARRRAKELGIDLRTLHGQQPGAVISLADVEQAAAGKQVEKSTEKQGRITPVARRMAEELGVDLNTVKGTGPNGSISRADVEQAATAKKQPAPSAKKPAAKKKPTVDFQAGMRRAIAAAMSRANRDIPHYYLETRINMTNALHWLEAENLQRSLKDRLLPAVLLIRATAKALVEVPDLNGFWLEDKFQPQEAINIGFAIAMRQGGLVTPAIRDADKKNLDELMVDMRELIMRTRNGRLRSSDLTDATITLTSLGDRGVEKVYGVIYPPQVALVGFGKIAEQPWVENGMIGVRQVVTATLAADHRASDGQRGGFFLNALNKQLTAKEIYK